MAVDVFSENFIGMNDNNNSPRFSFSKDVQENETINPINGSYNPYRLDHSLVMDSPFDFAFNIDSTTSFQSSTADELFSDGKILPTCVKKDYNAIIIPKVKQDVIAVQCLDPHQSKAIKKSLKEFLEDSSEEEEEEEQETSNNAVVPKPFWMFRRSNSLNCDNRNQKKGLIGSWKILSRSGSTGKFLEKILEEKPVKNPRFSWKFSRSNSLIMSDQNANIICNVGNNKGANTSVNSLRRSSSTNEYFTGKSDPKPIRRSNSTGSAPNHLRNKKQKQQEMGSSNNKSGHKVKVKNGKGYDFGSYYSNSGKISPVLNLPSPYISRVSVDLFGMGSLFCNSSTKDRKKKK